MDECLGESVAGRTEATSNAGGFCIFQFFCRNQSSIADHKQTVDQLLENRGAPAVNYSVAVFASVALLLLLAMARLALSSVRRRPDFAPDERPAQECLHISHLRQIKQALAKTDFMYLNEKGYRALAKRIRNERRHIALGYLTCLRSEFEKLLNLARMIAVMSPNVAVAQEVRGLRLNLEFMYRYYLIYFRLVSGVAPLEAIGELGNMVSGLTIRMETAMSELGERAALDAGLLPHNGGGLGAGG
jgi:hypothetical protein